MFKSITRRTATATVASLRHVYTCTITVPTGATFTRQSINRERARALASLDAAGYKAGL